MTNESDTYAQAEPGKAPGSTFERKEMSFKTLRKRIALVAVAALAVTGLSTVPANARSNAWGQVLDQTLTVLGSTTKLTGSTGLYCSISLEGSDTGAATCTGQVGGSVQVNYSAAAATTYIVRVTNATILATASVDQGALGTAVSDDTFYNGVDYANGITYTPSTIADQLAVRLTASAEGTSTITVHSVSSTTGALTLVDSASITWASASSLDPNPGYSRSIIDGSGTLTTNSHNATTDEIVIAPGTSAEALVAAIKVTARDGNNNLLANGRTISAVVSGPGVAGGAAAAIESYANASRFETVTLAGGTGIAFFGIYADGTTGTSTIQIYSGSTLLATETVVFHGRPAKVAVTQNHKIGSINGEQLGASAANPTGADIDNTPAVIVKVTDALGLPVSGQTVTAVSSDATLMTSAITCTESDGTGAGDAYAGEGSYNCFVTSVANPNGSGKSATMTFRVPDGITSGVYVSATPITYTFGKDPATVKLSMDKASYAPGEKMTLTVSGLGSDGKAAADDIYTGLLGATGLAGSTSIGGSLPTGASVALVGGVKTYTLYAPLVGGSFSISGTQGADTGTGLGAAISTSFTVANPADAQIAALVAAIAKLQAAINKINKRLKR